MHLRRAFKTALLLSAFFAAGRAGAAQADADFEPRLLGSIPESANVIVPPVFSRDGRRVLFAARADGSDRIVEEGRPGPAYELI